MCSSASTASSFLRVYSYTGEVSSIFGIIGGTWSLANAYTQKQNIEGSKVKNVLIQGII